MEGFSEERLHQNLGNPEILIRENGAYAIVVRGWIDEEDSKELFEDLLTNVRWTNSDVLIRGKRIAQPRLVYACDDEGVGNHKYAGTEVEMEPWIDSVRSIRDKITELGLEFNSCLLNYYRDGNDYIGFHSDREALGPNNSVVTVSLGGDRDFQFKRRSDLKTVVSVPLHSGDLVVMVGRTQELYKHAIPKRAHRKARISLTYRNLKEKSRALL